MLRPFRRMMPPLSVRHRLSPRGAATRHEVSTNRSALPTYEY
jgi:hypothetical protein